MINALIWFGVGALMAVFHWLAFFAFNLPIAVIVARKAAKVKVNRGWRSQSYAGFDRCTLNQSASRLQLDSSAVVQLSQARMNASVFDGFVPGPLRSTAAPPPPNSRPATRQSPLTTVALTQAALLPETS